MKAGLVGRWARVAVACAAVGFGLSAAAGSVHYVRTGGTGAGGADDPFGTIAAAVGVAQAGDEIRVAGGVYQEAVVVGVPSLTISGSWLDDFSAQDLRGHRTVVKAPAATSDCVTANDISLKLVGLDLTGGRYGFFGNHGSTRADKTPPPPWNTLWQCVSSNNTYGVYSTKADGLVLSSCLFAHNTTEGVFFNFDTGGVNYYYNCTFADNGEAGIRRNHNYDADMNVYNALVVGNAVGVYWQTTSPSKSILFRHSLFHGNGQDVLTGAYPDKLMSNIGFLNLLLKADPRTGADYALGQGSPAIGVGYDLSAEEKACPADLYGTAWDGRYDLGCIKSAFAPPAKADELYVATTGDDAQDGLTAETAKRTINAAAGLIRDGGTIRVAKGTYTESVALSVPNVTLLGEGRETTIIEAAATTAGAIAYSSTRPDFAVSIVATNVTVKNFTLRNAFAGAHFRSTKSTADSRLVNCRLTANLNGVSISAREYQRVSWTYLSHCIVNGNGNRGIYDYGALRIDNTLIADNANYGIFSDSWDQDAVSYFANVTFADNGKYGYWNNGADSCSATFDNCIFRGHTTAGLHARNTIKARSTCFFANAAPTEANTARNTSPVLTDCFYGDPALDTTAALRGHLGAGSSCVQTGAAYAGSPFDLSDDLDGNPRLADKVDVGCYVSDKTLEDLVGEGYHLLTVVGDPDGYGLPTPGYGKNLTKDGALTIDLRPILTTDAFDDTRVVSVDDGVRALYLGYVLTDDATGTTLRSSDTEENFTIGFDRNCTLTLKWELQYRIDASTASDGCTVQVADRPAGASCTAWVTAGETYQILFNPSVNFAFNVWTGDFPASGDPRVASTTAVSDRPHAITVATRPLLHVCTTGDDVEGDGTRAKPFATISRAVAVAQPQSVIYVQQGVYREAVVNTSVNHLSFRGGYDANWQRDLRNAQTFVIPPSATDDGFKLSGVYDNEVCGFVVTGARYGVLTKGPSADPGEGTRRTRQNVLSQLVVSNNVNGILCQDGRCGYRVVSCLVAYNGSCGIDWQCDNKADGFVHNCTIVHNGTAGIRAGYGYCWIDYRNNVLAFNGTHNVSVIQDRPISFSEFTVKTFAGLCVFGAGKADFETIYQGAYNSESGRASCNTLTGVYFLDPLLGDDFAPQAGSPCIATGLNLNDYPLATELEDLYGEAWNGVYDLGCLKGAAAPAKVAEVYVAPDGDDANDGLTSATPMRSVQKALLKLAENGTCRLAAGEYVEPIGLYVKGMTLSGAGVGETVIRGQPTAEGAEAPFNILVAADDVTVENLTSTGGQSGIQLSCSRFATDTLVRNCRFAGNTNGVYATSLGLQYNTVEPACYTMCPDYVRTDAPNHRMSRCAITDNAVYGVFSRDGDREGYKGAVNVLGDNLLVARNGAGGIRLVTYPSMVSRFFYTTVADNGGIGVGNGTANDGAYIKFVNGIVTGNVTGIQNCHYTGIGADNSVISGNGTNVKEGDHSAPVLTDCVDEGLAFDPSKPYHPAPGSSAIGLPRDLTAADQVAEPTVDLDGTPRKARPRRRVAGCFAEPIRGLLLLVR